jgi:hypothetical protein
MPSAACYKQKFSTSSPAKNAIIIRPIRSQGAAFLEIPAAAIRVYCFLTIAFTLLSASSSPQAEGHAAKAGPSIPGAYLPPNEQHPALALPIYRKSNHGVYISVGTERSFIGAALTRAKALCPASSILSGRIDSPKLLLRGGWLPHSKCYRRNPRRKGENEDTD